MKKSHSLRDLFSLKSQQWKGASIVTTWRCAAGRCCGAQLASPGLGIMALPSQAAAASFGELMPHQRPCAPTNGVYHRMEESDPSRRYRNKMQLTLREGSALLEREGHQPVTLHVDRTDNETFIIDWSPANDRWGQSELRFGSIEGAAGLIEEEKKFWKLHAAHPAEEVTSASGGRESRIQVCMNASEEVLASRLLPCRKCRNPDCEFRAPKGFDHCCWYCKTRDRTGAKAACPWEQEDAQTEDGHDAACSRLRMGVLARAMAVSDAEGRS